MRPPLGYRRSILSDPLGRALNRAVCPIDVPLCLAIIQWALIWSSVWGPGGGLLFGHGLKRGGGGRGLLPFPAFAAVAAAAAPPKVDPSPMSAVMSPGRSAQEVCHRKGVS